MGPHTQYLAVPGPLYEAYNAFAFATLIVGFAIILRAHLRATGAERTQAAIVLFGGLVPLISSALTESKVVPLAGLDLAPLAFLITGAVWLYAILRGTLLEVVPVARDTLVERMLDGISVLDENGQVVDANPAALALLNKPLSKVLGKSATAVFSHIEGASSLLAGSGAEGATCCQSALTAIRASPNSRSRRFSSARACRLHNCSSSAT